MLKLTRQSALDVTLEGSVGGFRVTGPHGAPHGGDRSVEVKYIATHVGFDLAKSANDALLRNLAPVRETFDFSTLGFSEIMQRDIDDARVSTELIPYLLNERLRGMVVLFPPIIVVALPINPQTARPAPLYPAVERGEELADDTTYSYIRSGAVGSEAFKLSYPVVDGQPVYHSFAKLQLNAARTRLVIIDGQHRAMALLALYRNQKDSWTDARRAPFKDYYAEWSPSRIGQYDLSELQLPVIVCVFPELTEGYGPNFDVIRAARSVFLALNKNARKVSDARNILLDDRDLVSEFLRRCLEAVKARDAADVSPFRIWNVELDAGRDRLRLDSPMALTGVMHLHYVLEHILFVDDGDVSGIGARSGKFYKRKTMENFLARLDGTDLLGSEAAAALRRDVFDAASAETLWQSFRTRYGELVLRFFDAFAPYQHHERAALATEKQLQGNTNPQIRNILFEGQGIGRTFDAYLAHLEERVGELKGSAPAELKTARDVFTGTRDAVADTLRLFQRDRATHYTDAITDRNKLREAGVPVPFVVGQISTLYQRVFTTVAFQAALICGFFGVVEAAERRASAAGAQEPPRQQSFDEYLDALNAFFAPASFARFRTLVRCFVGEMSGEKPGELAVQRTNQTFYSVVLSNELKPDEWPKLRYLLLELWHVRHAAADAVGNVLAAEVETARKQVFRSLRDRRAGDYSAEVRKGESEFTPEEWERITAGAYNDFAGFLGNLRAKNIPKRDAADAMLADPTSRTPDAASDPDAPIPGVGGSGDELTLFGNPAAA